ncbi:hypothetical protein B0H15DRAFT_942015 [Mycena belliarum]|uniref:Uncharacterized protein n=1 Tax=Mycena belliarum TaxID=1033014 RepID=A0AAD6UPX8_9AGAR|nr:hypothetical protein B0H15DRAFT_942015 [Mycena belliae]
MQADAPAGLLSRKGVSSDGGIGGVWQAAGAPAGRTAARTRCTARIAWSSPRARIDTNARVRCPRCERSGFVTSHSDGCGHEGSQLRPSPCALQQGNGKRRAERAGRVSQVGRQSQDKGGRATRRLLAARFLAGTTWAEDPRSISPVAVLRCGKFPVAHCKAVLMPSPWFTSSSSSAAPRRASPQAWTGIRSTELRIYTDALSALRALGIYHACPGARTDADAIGQGHSRQHPSPRSR